MKASDIREMTTEEMLRKVTELKQELFNLRFQHEIGLLENSPAGPGCTSARTPP